ncbi:MULTISPECIES: hypothetical protein [Legionella]|uniref:Transmembrane protein n=1 Tax=Legionella drozanskii LLAP-1 TaxID=1212489 RepID=A0A0W0TE48_9GAMM|nr:MULTISPECIES: hypothetical protein [Legionella]KTC93863.1 hypothetical protein Ldro_0213 [Legionella drozanskii LLAP-1]PJE10285.1 MAG: hypothetical protein CK430_10400 [Legionella sp.]
MNNDLTHSKCDFSPHISWSAIFSGAFIGVGLGFLLQLYGVAIGLSVFNASPNGTTAIAIGGLIGFLIGVIISMGSAGFVAGYLGRSHHCHCHGGVIYGFLTWSIALLLSALMIMPLSHYTSAYTKNLAPTISVDQSSPQPIAITSSANSSSSNMAMENNQTNVKVTPNTLTGSSWIMFMLFFIGAISSCIGACMSMKCKQVCHEAPTESTQRPVI